MPTTNNPDQEQEQFSILPVEIKAFKPTPIFVTLSQTLLCHSEPLALQIGIPCPVKQLINDKGLQLRSIGNELRRCICVLITKSCIFTTPITFKFIPNNKREKHSRRDRSHKWRTGRKDRRAANCWVIITMQDPKSDKEFFKVLFNGGLRPAPRYLETGQLQDLQQALTSQLNGLDLQRKGPILDLQEEEEEEEEEEYDGYKCISAMVGQDGPAPPTIDEDESPPPAPDTPPEGLELHNHLFLTLTPLPSPPLISSPSDHIGSAHPPRTLLVGLRLVSLNCPLNLLTPPFFFLQNFLPQTAPLRC
ncbi:hypothetical protein PSHT_15100, partial [Puccinia striiformis]